MTPTSQPAAAAAPPDNAELERRLNAITDRLEKALGRLDRTERRSRPGPTAGPRRPVLERLEAVEDRLTALEERFPPPASPEPPAGPPTP